MGSYVNQVKIGDTTHLIEPTLYASGAGTNSAITAAVNTNFTLVSGVQVAVKMSVDNAVNATLNISGTGAKNIRYNGNNIAAGVLKSGRVYNFIYDGSYWQVAGELLTRLETQSLIRPEGLNGVNDVTYQAVINDVRANRLAFLPADQIIIEKTTDGGNTWVDAGVSDATKTGLFSETRAAVYIPKINDQINTNCGLRITITGMKYNVPAGTPETEKYNYWNSTYVKSCERYNQIKMMYFWVSTANNAIKVTVQKATGANPNTWNNVFSKNDYGMTGWSGNDIITFGQGVFGGGTTQTGNTWNWRITLMTCGPNGSDTLTQSSLTYQMNIAEIRGYGDTWWTAGNKYAASDHLYSWDYNKNATFPANITATKFIGNGESLTSLNASNISSGTLSADRLATSGATAGSYGPSAAISGTDGTTMNVPYITVDNKGRITGIENKVYTSVNTWRPIGTGATDAAAGNHSHTLKIGYKSLSVSTSEQTWSLNNVLLSPSILAGASNSWDITDIGIYQVASMAGNQNPGSTTGETTPYSYGELIVTRAGGYGAAQFYISHNSSNTKNAAYGIRYRSGWDVVNHSRENGTSPWVGWATILDSKNYNLYSPKLDGTGATGSWNITADKATKDASGNTITSTYAPLASPALTGTPTAPTADTGTNTTQLATTAFVMNTFTANDSNYPKVFSYTIPATKGVRITYNANVPVLVSVQRTNSVGRLILIGGGYGAGGTIRNDWTELVSCSQDNFTWSIPASDSINCSIEVMSHQSSGDSVVKVWTNGTITFTEITALTTAAMNRNLLTSSNTTKPSSVPTLSWNTESTVFTLNGSAVKIKAMAKPTYTYSDVGAAASSHNHNASDINAGTLAIARIEDGSITNAKLENSKITIAGQEVSLGGSLTLANMGLSSAMHFRGKATVAITENSTTDPTISGYTFGTNGASALAGDVILDKDSDYEYVWTADGTSGKWEKLGSSSSYALSGHDHDGVYLKLAGGQMTGPLTWKDGTALPAATSLSYLLGIESFANGGGTKYITTANAWTALGGGASGKHEDSYFVKAITSTDNAAVRFDGTSGQIQNSGVIIDDDGNIKIPGAITVKNYSGYNLCKFQNSGNLAEIVIKTKFKFVSSATMPLIHIYGYAYGKQIPINIDICYYIYASEFYSAGIICTGGFNPDIYLFKYTENSIDYVAIGLKATTNLIMQYLGFEVDANAGALGTLSTSSSDSLCTIGWTVESVATSGSTMLIPEVGTDKCKKFNYGTIATNTKTASAANITSTKYGVAYYADAVGTFAGTGAGTSGQYLKSNGTSAPTWASFPSTWTPSSHTHGNITNDGKLSGSTVSGAVTTSHKFLREDGTWVVPAYTANTAYGNISTSGTIGQSSSWTLASGDGLVVFDSSNSNKLERTGITFDASTETQCLTKKGTWKTFGTSNLAIGTTSTTAMAGNTNVNNVTHTKRTDAANNKYYVTGTTSSATNTGGDIFDTGVYVTTVDGGLSAVRQYWNYSDVDKAYSYFNNTTQSIDFVFI